MKKFLSVLLVMAILIGTIGFATVSNVDAAQRVRGYYRKNGTYVQPYFRSDRNSSKWDNYSTKGNINPFTGKRGTKNIYKYP